MGTRTWTDEQLTEAVALSHSWRGVGRSLGLKGTSASVMRSVKGHVERLELSTKHFTHERTWSDRQLKDAVQAADTWAGVLRSLALTDRSETRVRVKGRAVRLGIDVAHLEAETALPPVVDVSDLPPEISMLRVAAEPFAIAWFRVRGVPVAVPSDPCAYDLLVTLGTGVQRVQVKSGTRRTREGTWSVIVGRRPYSRHNTAGIVPYDPDELDLFFVIDGDGIVYLIPVQAVAGRPVIAIRKYDVFRVGDASSLFTTAA